MTLRIGNVALLLLLAGCDLRNDSMSESDGASSPSPGEGSSGDDPSDLDSDTGSGNDSNGNEGPESDEDNESDEAESETESDDASEDSTSNDEATTESGNASEDYYGDPANGCQPSEKAVNPAGLGGTICAPLCGLDGECPEPPAPGNAQARCIFAIHTDDQPAEDETPTHCGLICTFGASPDECEGSGSCKSLPGSGGLGICTHP